MKYLTILLILLMNISLLAQAEITTERVYPKSKREKEMETMGSITEGVNFTVDKVKNTDSRVRIGNVNKYLYQSVLEIFKIAPITSADSYAGVISTDWYLEKEDAEIRYRVNVYIKDDVISPEAIEVKAFQEEKATHGWKKYKRSPDKAALLEEEILRVARLLYQKDKK